jgi:ABC-type transport system involved in cytochrome bd biosynthesis fused ATPase/permease subunit
LLDAAQGKTIVLVSHQPALIAQAEHVVRLEAGRVSRVSRAASGGGRPLAVSS